MSVSPNLKSVVPWPIAICLLVGISPSFAQSVLKPNSAQVSSVPPVIRFGGILKNVDGTPRTTLTNVTFRIFKDAEGGKPIWTETQNVQPDSTGRFAVFLGVLHAGGLPQEIFVSGAARWIETGSDGLAAQSRSALVSVPYALEAADAQTLDGRPISDFLLKPAAENPGSQLVIEPIPPRWDRTETAPKFLSTTPGGPSFVSKAISGAPFEVHSKIVVPNLNADLFRGHPDTDFAVLSYPNGFIAPQTFYSGVIFPGSILPDSRLPNSLASAPEDFQSMVPNPTGGRVTRTFRWSSNPTAAAQLSLAFGATIGDVPVPTGFSINSDGTLNFAAAQQFPPAAIAVAISSPTSSDPAVTPIVYTAGYKWQQQPPTQVGATPGISPGWNSVTLSPCPNGVNGNDNWHYLFISGTGQPEAVLISGGTCVSGAKSGTIQFTAAYGHPIGYSIGTATAGLQEAVNATMVSGANGTITRSVVINPGQYLLMARLSIRASDMHIAGYGATINCAVSDTCIMMGDPSNSTAFLRIVLEGIQVMPGVQNGTFSAIEDNANGSQIRSISPVNGTNPAYSFGHLLQIDNDQAASMDRIDTNSGYGAIRCDQQFCGSAIFAPGPFATNAGVGWISNSNISLQCTANGVDWQSGNTLQILNTVIQGYAQFGVRAGGARGGFGGLKMDNVYEEAGVCPNPAGNIGQAGVIAQGGDVRISGGEGPQGDLPCYSTNCSSQLTRYYVIAQNSAYGASNPLGAGVALMTDATTVISWPEIPGAMSYDLLAQDNMLAWYAGNSPSGSGAFAVAVNVLASGCSGGVCTYVDSHGPRLDYTLNAPTYFPLLRFWPGSIVLGSSQDTSSSYSPSVLYTDVAPSGIVGEQGSSRTAVWAQSCNQESAVSPLWIQCEGSAAPPTGVLQQATIMLVKPNNDGNLQTNTKGRLNFATLGTGPSHIITLSDSNFPKTIASPANRPSNDPDDAFIGYDQGDGNPTHIGISFGAPVSLSNYIGNVGDGTNWMERLTASLKTFTVPVQTTAVAFSALPTCDSGAEGATRAVVDSTTNTWGATIAGSGGNHVLAYCDGTDWTVAAK